MEHLQNSNAANSVVPTLSQLILEHFAVRLGNEDLPPYDYQFTLKESNFIFEKHQASGKLNEKTMEIMCASGQFVIDRIDLSGSTIEPKHLYLCSKQDIIHFRLGSVGHYESEIHLPEWLTAALNPTSRQQLKTLNLTGSKTLDEMWPLYVAENFPSLESLTFAYRPTQSHTLELIGSHLLQLRTLNLSSTGVTDISVLANLKNLEVLIMYNVNITSICVDTLAQLTNLRVLDISNHVMSGDEPHICNVADEIYRKCVEAVENGIPTPWQKLQLIDMSSRHIDEFDTDKVHAAVQKMALALPNLGVIGLLHVSADLGAFRVAERHIKVITKGSAKALNVALSHNIQLQRPQAILNTLILIAERMKGGEHYEYSPEVLEDCIQLVCLAMKRFQNNICIAMYANDCFRSLCNLENVSELSAKTRKEVIDRTLDAIEYFRPLENYFSDVEIDELQTHLWTLVKVYLRYTNDCEVDFLRIFEAAIDTMRVRTTVFLEKLIADNLAVVTPKLTKGEGLRLHQEDVDYILLLFRKYVEDCCVGDRFGNIEIDDSLECLENVVTMLQTLIRFDWTTFDRFLEGGYVKTAMKFLKHAKNIEMNCQILEILHELVFVEKAPLEYFCQSDVISVLISSLSYGFPVTDREVAKYVKGSYTAATILTNLLFTAPGCWEREEQREEVKEALLRQIIEWPDIDEEIKKFTTFEFLKEELTTSNSNGFVMLVLWTLHNLMGYEIKNESALQVNSYIGMFHDVNLQEVIGGIAEGNSPYLEHIDQRVVQQAKKILHLLRTHRQGLFNIRQN